MDVDACQLPTGVAARRFFTNKFQVVSKVKTARGYTTVTWADGTTTVSPAGARYTVRDSS